MSTWKLAAVFVMIPPVAFAQQSLKLYEAGYDALAGCVRMGNVTFGTKIDFWKEKNWSVMFPGKPDHVHVVPEFHVEITLGHQQALPNRTPFKSKWHFKSFSSRIFNR